MATIDNTAATTRSRKGFAKTFVRMPPRIDMTPMVDLVLLLIIFFVFTTSMTLPTTVDLAMPAPDGPPMEISEDGALSVLIGKDRALYYYEGKIKEDGSNIVTTNATGLRSEIIRRKAQVVAAYKPDPVCERKAIAEKRSIEDCKQQKMMVLIKPNADANYKSIVDVLDEMTINKIAHYSLVEPDKKELQFFK